ncbi:hypothetical protein C6502_02870 [Candidatus Poribacteria bacterium]|nr:MAG: hypothetical protein C6502_02870 [Candidatus Poribacteria bacterium]
MSAKKTSGALMTSLIVHGVVFVIAGIYLVTQTQQFRDRFGAEVLQAKEPPKPQVRKPVITPIKPTVPTTNTMVVEQVPVEHRVTTALAVRTTSVKPETVLKFSDKMVKLEAPIKPNMPKVVSTNAPVPQVVTHTDLPVSDAPGALAFASPVATAPSAAAANIGRGIGGIVQVKVAFERPAGLAMVEHVGAIPDALGDVVKSITIGNREVPPLPRGEPGGRVIGRGADIRGVFRFTRVRHSLSDWWADASSLNAWTKWMNERTKIKTDMNVEGGALKFTDANLHKAPLLFMTGHDPALTRSKNLMSRQYGGGKLDNRLSESEAAALRRYLVEKGGVLAFDDCGVNAPAQAMIRLFLAQMRFVMPEYQVTRIPNDHELYSNFYEMGGPPVGFDLWWWGTHPPKRNYLEGVMVGDHISVLVFRRDYMCAMESVSLPTRSVHYSPGVYRFMTNVAVYALTHGSISDYSGYVPEDTMAQKKLPTRAPEAARISAVE